jgi:glycosyltransferase 2 family protein
MNLDTTGTAVESRRTIASHRKRHALQVAVGLAVLFITAIPLSRPVGLWEENLFGAVNGLPNWLLPPVWVVMQVGNLLTVTVVSLVALIARRFRQGLDLAVAGVSAWLLAKVVKEFAGRARPAEIFDDVIVRGSPAAGNGYVSGHAAVAAALAAALTPYLSRKWQVVVWCVVALVAFGRIYVGAHLPLDVIGGVAMGWAIGSIVHVLLGEPGRHEGKSADATS